MNITRAPLFPCLNLTHAPAQTRGAHTADGLKIITSQIITPDQLFDGLVLSPTYHTQTEGCFLLEAQVRVHKSWSPFYRLGFFAPRFRHSFRAQQDAFARVAVDELLPAQPAHSYRYRMTLYGDIEITTLHAALTCPAAPIKGAQCLPKGARAVEVEPISQIALKHKDATRVCSPVSLTMALRALGVNVSVDQTMQGVYDFSAEMYGNWILNTAYAGLCGTESYVRRFYSLAELEEFVTKDSLVLASVAYEPGELPGAPQARTSGHLLVIRGYKDGEVLTADPAAKVDKEVLRAYKAQDFARAWLINKKGVAYIVRKK